jgi:membrane protease YdiL (CAAX protease family)
MTAPAVSRSRPFLYLGVFLIVPFTLGCLLAPWVFRGVRALGDYPIFAPLAEERFERVATRTVQVIALLLVWPCLKRSGTVARVAPMLKWRGERGRVFLRWFAFGALTVMAVYATGFASGVYQWDARNCVASRVAILTMSLLVGALLVGFLEEYLFRGFIYGILREKFSTFASAVASSAFFSVVHFLRPRLPSPPETVTWTSGFELIPHMFTLFRPAYDWDFALTLFFIGLALCGLLARQGNFYGIAGLHAGLVWVLQVGNYLVDQTPRHHNFWYGWGDNPAQGALVTLVAGAFAAGTWFTLCRARRSCSDPRDSATTLP